MKNNIFLGEIVASVVLFVLLFFFLNPLGYMSPTLLNMLTLLLIVVFGIFVGFVWKERPRDEREQLHSMIAGRVAFLVGTGVLVLGIVLESFQHTVSPWLVIALGAMVLAKIGAVVYGRARR